MSDFDLLVIDDEPVVAQAARRLLEPEGVALDTAPDRAAALDKLRRHGYGLILLDLMLPGVSGLELLEALVAEHPRTPVIVTTGYASSRKGVEVFKAGAFDFLPKPFDVDELLGVVRRGRSFDKRSPESQTLAECIDRYRRERRAADAQSRLYFLGAHSWARIEEDGLATVGLAESFCGALGGSPRIDLPAGGSETVQGRRLARIESAGACVHRVWSPLSGRVAGGNPRLESDPELAQRSPFGSGWLIRMAPTNLREELAELVLR